jgi:hypothetical protein
MMRSCWCVFSRAAAFFTTDGLSLAFSAAACKTPGCGIEQEAVLVH